jgi:cellulose biosynthesis protein BcsQ
MADVIVGVLGGSGGVGASTFAATIAAAAQPAVLVDLDPVGGGIDVLLGIETAPGARWSGVRVDGGHLDPQLLADGLPHWQSVAVLAADVSPPSPDVAVQVIETAAQLGDVVLDLPRAPGSVRDAALVRCALAVVVASTHVRELAAARAVLGSLPDVPAGVVLRRGALPVSDAVALLGVPLLGELPPLDRAQASRVTARVAAGVLDGLAA